MREGGRSKKEEEKKHQSLAACQSVVCLFLSACLPACLFACLSVCLPVRLSIVGGCHVFVLTQVR
jgi:hypothetical protein